MKQGKATSDTHGSRKREPIIQVISPGGAAQLGVSVIQNPTPLKEGRAFMAPEPEAETVHEGGTQRKHK
jgi:hypothetical protein